MIKPKKAIKSFLIIIIFAFGSKVLGFIREALMAAKFGSGADTDIFFIALTAVSLFTSLLTHAIKTTTIPILSEIEEKRGKKEKINYVNNLLSVIILVCIFLVALGWVISPFVIRLIAYGFGQEQYDATVTMMRIGLPVLFFSGIVGVFRGYLQSELMFNESAATQFPYNFVYIFFLLFLSKPFGITGLMVASVLAVGAQILIQIPGLRKAGYHYRFAVNLHDPYIKKMVRLTPSVFVSVAANDLNKIVNRALASKLVQGSVSALHYANSIMMLILEVFITGISTVIFPVLAQEANKASYEGLKRISKHTINLILLITLPATVGIIVLAMPIIRVAFQRGAFDATAAVMTRDAMIFYAVGLTGMSLRMFLEKEYYALQDTKTPMVNGVIGIALNIVLNILFVDCLGIKGLALATSLSATATSAMLLYGLKKKIGALGTMKIIQCGLKALCASLIMGASVYFVYHNLAGILPNTTLGVAFALLSAILAGILVYLVFIHRLQIEEVNWAVSLVKKRFSKKTSGSNG